MKLCMLNKILTVLFLVFWGVPSMSQSNSFRKPALADLKKKLTPQQYNCTQEEGTEPPFQNKYWNHHEDGIYVDVVSGEALFSSLDKYDSGSGWPSFTKPIEDRVVTTKSDMKLGYERTEIRSTLADSHLGHVFNDGPGPNGKRFCVNSASLRFVPLNKMKEEGYGQYLFQFVESKKWDVAVLAGGCFWGVQELYRQQKGVIFSEVGYTGGDRKTASYDNVKTGQTGHAEAVRIIYDPKEIKYEDLLVYFFKIHDPTKKNRQGNDVGTQYRSEIFALNKIQKEIAEKVIERVEKSKKWKEPVVTKINESQPFFRAEEVHQDYLVKHPYGYTCHFKRDIEF